MPKVNFNVPFLSSTGQPVKDAELDYNKQFVNDKGQIETALKTDGEGNPLMRVMLLKEIVLSILHDNYDGDMALPGSERIRRHELAVKVHNSVDATDFTIEELHMIQELAARKRPTLVLGRLAEAINAN